MWESKSAGGGKRKVTVTVIVFIILALVVLGCYIYDTQTGFFTNLFGKEKDPPLHAEGDLTIHFVDVGQGDSIIIQFPDNKTMIIDGGPDSKTTSAGLLAYIDNLGIKTFDYLLLTHSDNDHCGNLDDVINEYEIRTIFMPDVNFVTVSKIGTKVYESFVIAAQSEKFTNNENKEQNANIIYSNPDADFSGAGYKMDFITPNVEGYDVFKKNNPSSEEINSISPIIILTFADKKIMLTGDANEITEGIFLETIKGSNIENYNVDILKVAHHGSRSSTLIEFLKVVKPEIAVIPVGAGNTYGHPTQELLTRLKTCNDNGGAAEVYRTDLNGDIVFKLTANGNTAQINDPILEKKVKSSSIKVRLSKDHLACLFLNIKKFSF